MGMMHEPGWISPARKPSQQETLSEIRFAQREAAALYERARQQQEDGKEWAAAITQEYAQNVSRASRFLMGLPR